MNGGAIALLVVAAVLVFAIAAGTVGREAHRLDAVAPRAVYEIEEAVTYVGDRLPEFAASALTYDDVRTLLLWHLNLLRDKGLMPKVAVDQVQDIATPVVVEETTAVGQLIAKAEQAGLDVRDEDIAAVVDVHFAYLDAIGAIGPLADDPDVPLA